MLEPLILVPCFGYVTKQYIRKSIDKRSTKDLLTNKNLLIIRIYVFLYKRYILKQYLVYSQR
jgi:hypothetical protein